MLPMSSLLTRRPSQVAAATLVLAVVLGLTAGPGRAAPAAETSPPTGAPSAGQRDDVDEPAEGLPGQRIAEIVRAGRSSVGTLAFSFTVANDRPGVPLTITLFGCNGEPALSRTVAESKAKQDVVIIPGRRGKLGSFIRVDATWANPDGDHTLTYGSNASRKDRNREDKGCRHGRPPRLAMQGDQSYPRNAEEFEAVVKVKHLPPSTQISLERWIRAEQRWAVEQTTVFRDGQHAEPVLVPGHGERSVLYRACGTTAAGLTSCSEPRPYFATGHPVQEEEPRRAFTDAEETTWLDEALATINQRRAADALPPVTRDAEYSEQTTYPVAQRYYETGSGRDGPTPRRAYVAGLNFGGYDVRVRPVDWLLDPALESVGLSVHWDESGGFDGAYLAYVVAASE